MSSVKSFFKEWFGYTRRERRSALILIILILLVTGVRYLMPAQKITIEEIPIISSYAFTDTNKVSKSFPPARFGKTTKKQTGQRHALDLNSCDSASLESLPGLGPVLSLRIIKYRNLIGGYVSVDQLKEVYGMPEETIKIIKERVYADTALIKKVKVNIAEYKELIRNPYFKKEDVTAILKYRELKGDLENIEQMTENNLISPETLEKLKPYLDFKKR